MTNRTIAPENDGNSQKLMLHELAPKVALVHCQRRDEAVAVQDGEIPPPADWQSELDRRLPDFIKYTMTDELERVDSDLFVAATRLGAPGTSWQFEAWQRCTPNWKTRIARARREMRREIRGEKRKIFEERAVDIIAGVIAAEQMQKATEQIQLALRAAMMGLGAAVRATSDTGERRQLDRAEIAEADIDHVHNTLEIRGRVWCDVEVERKARESTAAPKSKGKRAEPVDDQTVMTWLQDQIRARRKKKDDTIRPTMIWVMLDQFRAQGLTRTRAGKIYGKLPKPYKGTPGPVSKSNTD